MPFQDQRLPTNQTLKYDCSTGTRSFCSGNAESIPSLASMSIAVPTFDAVDASAKGITLFNGGVPA